MKAAILPIPEPRLHMGAVAYGSRLADSEIPFRSEQIIGGGSLGFFCRLSA